MLDAACFDESRNAREAFHGRELLSFKEVVTLADVPEKRVRKDLETGVLRSRVVKLADSRMAFSWNHVIVVAAVYSNHSLTGKLRRTALSKLDSYCLPCTHLDPANSKFSLRFACFDDASIDIDRYITLNLKPVVHSVSPRLNVYYSGLSRVEERHDVLGGEAIFRDSRLSVMHVGKMVESGEAVANILEDYPYLNEDDVRFASLYFRAHPAVGRPRAFDAGADDAEIDAG